MQYTNALHICAEDRMTLLYSYSVNGAVRGVFGALLNGAALYPLAIREEGLAHLANFIMQEEITFYHSVPTAFRSFARALTGKERFPRLRLIRFGGERVLARDVELYKKYFPDDCSLYTGMGSTETGQVCQYFIDKQTRLAGGVVPTGYPVEDKDVVLVDDAGEEIGANVGEIAIKSRYLSPGYWRRPDLTRAKFQPDGRDKRVYRTGDLARMHANGCLEHIGRKDFQVKIRGYAVNTAEVETGLLDHPALKEAAVAVEESDAADRRLVAYFVPEKTPGPGIAELRSFLQQKLPDYMIPSNFVRLPALPLTPNGKVDRRVLPAPGQTRPEIRVGFVAPRTDMEAALAKIWAEVLKVDRVGIHDNFFELGGHSLLIMQIVSKIMDGLQVAVPLRGIFDAPTVAELAQLIATLCPSKDPAEQFSNELANEYESGKI
jgi:acyl-coenzyme A synthetase/AMP-(fatty) acid ligase/acyl carrier protein